MTITERHERNLRFLVRRRWRDEPDELREAERKQLFSLSSYRRGDGGIRVDRQVLRRAVRWLSYDDSHLDEFGIGGTDRLQRGRDRVREALDSRLAAAPFWEPELALLLTEAYEWLDSIASSSDPVHPDEAQSTLEALILCVSEVDWLRRT